jgi:histidinol-phosphatase (PHP family)
MIRCDYHCHTTYCDGNDTVDTMAQGALAAGICALGFSGHSTTYYDMSYCMQVDEVPHYVADVLEARKRYAGQMEIYLGVEDDFHGQRPTFKRDYTIGSVHCVYANGKHYPVDYLEKFLREAVQEGFGGDFYRLTASYFQDVAQVLERTHCDVIGHFDLVAKLNERCHIFDETDRRYIHPAMEALEHLCKLGGVFEINTGAITRGYRTVPYPAEIFLRAIREFGGAITFSSDSHSADAIGAYFDQAVALAQHCGFQTSRCLLGGRWQEIPLSDQIASEL